LAASRENAVKLSIGRFSDTVLSALCAFVVSPGLQGPRPDPPAYHRRRPARSPTHHPKFLHRQNEIVPWKKTPDVIARIEALIEYETAGAPMGGLTSTITLELW